MDAPSDEIKVDFNPGFGQVSLSCDDQAFDKLWAFVADKAGPIEGAPAAVRMIVIGRVVRPTPRPFRWWDDPLGMVGCGVVVFAVLFVLTIGIGTIAGWVW